MDDSGRLRWHVRVATTTALFISLLMSVAVPATSSTLFHTLASSENDDINCLANLPVAAFQEISPGVSSLSHIFEHLLPNILIERVSGTPGNLLVIEFIKHEMTTLGWLVEEDTFRDSTPYGVVTFSNIVATLNPAATKRVVIACHYDSKFIPGEEPFVGASDSAVPCSIMMDTARLLSRISRISPGYEAQDITLQLLFLDGEEAYVQWTSTDSLYGSRHLADLWEHTPDPNDPTAANNLVNINFFILLDLIGTSDTRFVNYYANTTQLFERLVSIEQCLRVNGLLTRENADAIFSPNGRAQIMEDDHVPFIRRGVPVLHLISTPFPKVWHTVYDDLLSLDIDLINDFSRILHIFLLSVLYGV